MRAVVAVVAGVVLWGALWAGAGAGLAAAMPGSFDADGFTQSAGLLLLLLAVSVLLSLLAGYTAAAIARAHPMRTVQVLAGIQLLIGVAVQASVWDRMPPWFHLPFLALVVPAHLFGGRLRVARASAPAPTPASGAA